MSTNIIPSDDLFEAINAFTEKRKPTFTGKESIHKQTGFWGLCIIPKSNAYSSFIRLMNFHNP